MASHLLITLEQMLGMVAGTDKEGLKSWEPEYSTIPKEELDAFFE